MKELLKNTLGTAIGCLIFASLVLYGLEHDNGSERGYNQFRVQYAEQSQSDYAMDQLNDGLGCMTDTECGCIHCLDTVEQALERELTGTVKQLGVTK